MILEIHIDGSASGHPGPAAAAVVMADATTCRVLYEGARFLGNALPDVATYHALILALEQALTFSPEEVRLHSQSNLVVKQVIGDQRPDADELNLLLSRVQELLLSVDVWQIHQVAGSEDRRVSTLTQMALEGRRDVVIQPGREVKPLSPASGTGAGDVHRDSRPQVGVPIDPDAPAAVKAPRWKVKLTAPGAKACPAKCPVDRVFRFGPTTPDNLCVHAAQAVFDEEPTHWVGRPITAYDTQCTACGAAIHIELE